MGSGRIWGAGEQGGVGKELERAGPDAMGTRGWGDRDKDEEKQVESRAGQPPRRFGRGQRCTSHL